MKKKILFLFVISLTLLFATMTALARCDFYDAYGYHNFSGKPVSNNSNHKYTCVVCNTATKTEEHSLGTAYKNVAFRGQHARQCSKCYGYWDYENHTYNYNHVCSKCSVKFNNGASGYTKHTYASDGKCSICGKACPHSNYTNYQKLSGSKHSMECADCGKSFEESHNYEYTDNGNGTHRIACKNCEHVNSEAARHLSSDYVYTPIDSTGHQINCQKCGAKVADKENHKVRTYQKNDSTHTAFCY